MNFITAAPIWLVLFCVLLALLFSWGFYFYRFKDQINLKLRLLLAFFRFLIVFMIALILLSPLVMLRAKEVEKPLIVFAQDNSKSILYTSDSAFYTHDYLLKIKNVSEKLSEKFDFRFYPFDAKVHKSDSISFNGNETNLYALFQQLQTTFGGRNVGGLILATDGIYNKSESPYSLAETLPFPIYSVVMGDTTQKVDLVIRSVDYNKTTYYKNTFPIEIQVAAFNLFGKKSILTVSSSDRVLFSKEIAISSNKYSQTIRLYVDANIKGLQKYHINLTPVEGEFTAKNNQYDIFVNVRDVRDKVLITYQTPHPDIAAIKEALATTDMYQVDVKSIQDINQSLNDYKVVFAYQLPDVKNNANELFINAKKNNIPIVYIIGSQTSIPQFNGLNSGAKVEQKNKMWNDVFPALNPNFVIFSSNDDFKQYLQNLPPLKSPFGSFLLSNSVSTFLFQRVGNFSSSMPLVSFNDQLGQKNCVVFGEGIWKWRLACYQQYNHYRFFDEMINKIPQYLVAQSDNSNFRVKINQLFNQSEPITAKAELYNLALELDNNPEVSFVVTNNQGKKFPYSFSRENRSYTLDLGQFSQGEYNWVANTKLGDQVYQKSGAFIVQDIDIESLNLTADISLLRSLSILHGGKTLSARNVDQVVDEIAKNPNIKPISFYSKSYTELSNSWFYLLLIFVIAISEWFIRKYNGLL